MPHVFISYRRDDTGVVAGRLYDQLVLRFGAEAVFMDTGTIPYGVDYRAYIADSLRNCRTVLALIGPRWDGGSADGHRRIDDDADLVRIELEEALRYGVRVIPVLVDDQPMPRAAELPSQLRLLPSLNSAPLNSTRDFLLHAGQLIAALGEPSMRAALPQGRALYEQLWQLVEEAHMELRNFAASPEEIAARIRAVNKFILTQAPHLDDRVHTLSSVYLGLLERFKDELVSSGDVEVQKQFHFSAEIPLESVRSLQRLADLLQQVDAARAEFLQLVRDCLAGRGGPTAA